jgi:hypothetical protein
MVYPRRGVSAAGAVKAVLASLGPRAGFHPEDGDAVKWFDTGQFLDLVDLFYAGFSVFIGAAGIITLLIGAVGIANYHLATLAERSVEIAVCKAIGARSRVLIFQTVLDSLLVSGGAALGGVSRSRACVALGRIALLAALPRSDPLASDGRRHLRRDPRRGGGRRFSGSQGDADRVRGAAAET